MMAITHKIQSAGQSVWLDSISRSLLESGTLANYIKEYCVTGLTSNPSIFEKAIANSNDYDAAIRENYGAEELSVEDLFFKLALIDISEAADLFRPVYDETKGIDGFVSLEVSPNLANDAEKTIAEGKRLFSSANRPNLLIKVPGTKEGNIAIEELVYAGVNINVTLLFSPEQYIASAEAYIRGLQRRAVEGLSLNITSVASLFISRWDVPTAPHLPDHLANKLGIAIGEKSYGLYCDLFSSEKWNELSDKGANPQRLLWASTGTKDPALPDTYYVSAFIAPDTVNTLPEKTLLALAVETMEGGFNLMSKETRNAEAVLQQIESEGIAISELAERLQTEGRDAFISSWTNLMNVIQNKSQSLQV